MNRFLYHSKLAAPYAAALMCCALIFGTATRANSQVDLSSTVTFDALLSLYTYDYTVTNNTPDPVALVSFGVLALPDAVQNPAAPPGFAIFFEAVLGQVDLVEDTETFAPGTPIPGFTFQSPYAPNPSVYTYVNANTGQAFFGGTTLAPTAAAAPEPSALALGLGIVPFAALLLRRRRLPVA